MKLITRETDYALRALCFIAKKNESIISVSELVQVLKVPRPILRKILQLLQINGILHSYKGKGGGFTLAKKSDNILLVDIIQIFQGTLSLNECLLKKMRCPHTTTCPLRKQIRGIEDVVVKKLKAITLASLLR
ncbi:MAG: Rrf2 family transcriptional regulator [Candidatus Omnitrophica bacterium]|nr:Rrf2 family transcriptional regulator [Candidatus Omnitrophota bacterium]